jgi:hypothetical protein
MARGAGCLNWARPDLWGAEVGNCPGLPDRGSLGSAYLFPGPFGRRCLKSFAMLRFHTPLIEPGGRFSRTGLSDKNSRVRPREVARPFAQAHQPQYLVQVPVGES